MQGAIPPLPQYVCMVWYLIKQWIYLHGMILCQAQGQLYLSIMLQIINSICKFSCASSVSIFKGNVNSP